MSRFPCALDWIDILNDDRERLYPGGRNALAVYPTELRAAALEYARECGWMPPGTPLTVTPRVSGEEVLQAKQRRIDNLERALHEMLDLEGRNCDDEAGLRDLIAKHVAEALDPAKIVP